MWQATLIAALFGTAVVWGTDPAPCFAKVVYDGEYGLTDWPLCLGHIGFSCRPGTDEVPTTCVHSSPYTCPCPTTVTTCKNNNATYYYECGPDGVHCLEVSAPVRNPKTYPWLEYSYCSSMTPDGTWVYLCGNETQDECDDTGKQRWVPETNECWLSYIPCVDGDPLTFDECDYETHTCRHYVPGASDEGSVAVSSDAEPIDPLPCRVPVYVNGVFESYRTACEERYYVCVPGTSHRRTACIRATTMECPCPTEPVTCNWTGTTYFYECGPDGVHCIEKSYPTQKPTGTRIEYSWCGVYTNGWMWMCNNETEDACAGPWKERWDADTGSCFTQNAVCADADPLTTDVCLPDHTCAHYGALDLEPLPDDGTGPIKPLPCQTERRINGDLRTPIQLCPAEGGHFCRPGTSHERTACLHARPDVLCPCPTEPITCPGNGATYTFECGLDGVHCVEKYYPFRRTTETTKIEYSICGTGYGFVWTVVCANTTSDPCDYGGNERWDPAANECHVNTIACTDNVAGTVDGCYYESHRCYHVYPNGTLVVDSYKECAWDEDCNDYDPRTANTCQDNVCVFVPTEPSSSSSSSERPTSSAPRSTSSRSSSLPTTHSSSSSSLSSESSAQRPPQSTMGGGTVTVIVMLTLASALVLGFVASVAVRGVA